MPAYRTPPVADPNETRSRGTEGPSRRAKDGLEVVSQPASINGLEALIQYNWMCIPRSDQRPAVIRMEKQDDIYFFNSAAVQTLVEIKEKTIRM